MYFKSDTIQKTDFSENENCFANFLKRIFIIVTRKWHFLSCVIFQISLRYYNSYQSILNLLINWLLLIHERRIE